MMTNTTAKKDDNGEGDNRLNGKAEKECKCDNKVMMIRHKIRLRLF